MKHNIKHFNGIYKDMILVLGEDVTKQIHHFYRGQQVTFPMRLYSREYTKEYLMKHYTGSNLKKLSRELGYSERWVKGLINQYQIEDKKEKKEA